ncbi:MAG: hypothetical protein GOU97_01130 [Nanoarchaeota archaeon]|nr:hypothetical protein [Nanoarchaeota archaeon]
MKLNKKGLEGLPMKYVILALVAALVIGIILDVTGILGTSILSSANQTAEALGRATTNTTSRIP